MGIVQMTDQNEQMDVCGQIPHFSNLSLQPIPKPSPLKLERKYAIQLTQLQKKGFKNKKRCLRLLDQFHGNVHQAELILSQSNPRGPNAPQRALRQQYSEELQRLQLLGFKQPGRNLKALIKFQGDVDQALQFLQTQRKLNPRQQETKDLREKFGDQGRVLKQQGFSQLRRNLLALKQSDGDLDLAKQWLIENRSRQAIKIQALEQQFADQLVQLEQAGYPNRKRNIRILNKVEGNLQQAIEQLEHKANSLPKRLVQVKELYANEYKALVDLPSLAQQKPRVVCIALKKFNGDADKASLWLKKRLAK